MTVLFMYLFIYWMLVIYLIFIYLSYFCTNVNSFAHISVIFPFLLCLTDPKNKNKNKNKHCSTSWTDSSDNDICIN